MAPIKRLFDIPYFQKKNYPLEKAFSTKYDGKWVSLSTSEFIDKANQVSRGLLKLGVKKGDKIGLISTNNRTEWNVMDMGILQLGALNVPIYPQISEEEYSYVLQHSEAVFCFVSDEEVYEKVKNIRHKIPTLKEVYTFDEILGAKNWKEILDLGESSENQIEVEKIKNSIREEDLATLIYTSGTTGKPKGVMLSHKNIVSNVLNSSCRLPLEKGNATAMSFLPVCHVYERMLHYLYQYNGVKIYFAESLDKISDNLKEAKPHVMTAVPRLMEKVYNNIIAKGAELNGLKKSLFFWAVDVGLKYEPYGQNGWWYEQKLKLARKLIFSKWKEALGGNLQVIASGSAALQPRLSRVFNAANLGLMEGYGLTETSPVISVNDMRDGGFKIGTVGKPIPETEVKIAEDGEILIKGPQVMVGYYKDPQQTAEVLKNGYFHTGDIGKLDEDGFLKITDRKKEIFKTSGGKYIAPQLLENAIKQSRFVEQVMVIGEGEKMPAAFIQPDFVFLKEWAKRKNLPEMKNEELIQEKKVINRISKEVDFYNQKFGKWEKIKRFELTPEIWTVENGLLTPTLKLKRKEIKERYIELYKKIYESES
ncbi:MAG TPA: AMP-dependent synthetase/ligase [Flavobacteriaceae bacterium]|nr:AMP-dependent synthetase/ligase [Flavobacteriaceae bacterium]